ncbi:HCL132Wp [Eremothecium sinecaudum]|uniref:Translation initiation factor IF-2, mitochondrial n=1 Tax=Eremothecium sinecaudum TaxID=45286 RepID=A0A0X8HRC4_9SACH|nr:HCL132Wp [Eremothecium sinecaudum]AMD20019.1 HCL132Wp [Eremothecium sinecaudum]
MYSKKLLFHPRTYSKYFQLRSTFTVMPIVSHLSIRTIKTSSKNKPSLIPGSKHGQLKPFPFPIPPAISVKHLSDMLKIKRNELTKVLKNMGCLNVSSDYMILRDTLIPLLEKYNYQIPAIKRSYYTSDDIYDFLKTPIDPEDLEHRPPVVTIMGHVDHGKTTILDYLRKSTIAAQESGGITQKIGAFQVIAPISRRKITFLDTPGHAAFLKMRARGANITDIIVLVVSSEDSIMPQTIEAIKHTKASGNELIVAITKIDKFHSEKDKKAAIERVERDLMNHNIEVESAGGNVQVVPVSAVTGENMDLLEESIIALSDTMALNAAVSPITKAEAWVLESEITKGSGALCRVLVKNGELRTGSYVICGNLCCRIRMMRDENGKQIKTAGPSAIAEISGWKDLPDVGSEVIEVENIKVAKEWIGKREALLNLERNVKIAEKLNRIESEKLGINEEKEDKDEQDGPKKVNFIVKADLSGSAEAIVESIAHLGNNEVVCHVVESSVGIPSENDIELAKVSNAIILCFNLGSIPNTVLKNKGNIEIREYNVIYNLIEDVTKILVDNLEPIYEEKIIGMATIKELFKMKLKNKFLNIAGCQVLSGKLARNSLIKVLHGPSEEVIYNDKVMSLRQNKINPSEVIRGSQCGITLRNNFDGYSVGDKIVIYEKVPIQRHL